jgi:hypothetical protein
MNTAIAPSQLKEALGILSDGGYFKSCIETFTDGGQKFKTRLYDKNGKKDKRFRFTAFRRLLPFLSLTESGTIGRRYVLP